MSIEKLDEVLILLKSHELEASHIAVDGDRIEIAGVRALNGPRQLSLPKRKEPDARQMMFMHTGIVPKHQSKEK